MLVRRTQSWEVVVDGVLFGACYIGFCTPRRTLMEPKKKKKQADLSNSICYIFIGVLDPEIYCIQCSGNTPCYD